MANHRSVLAGLSPDIRAALTARSDLAGISQSALHLTVIALMGAWILAGWPLWWVLLWPQGVALAFLFTAQHEATHRTPFQTGWLNEALGHVTGILLVQPFLWFRAFHMAHHKYTGDPDHDPELASPKPTTKPALLWTLSGLSYWAMKARVLARNAKGQMPEPYIPDTAKPRIMTEARVYLALYSVSAVLALLTPLGGVILWGWLIPLVLGFPVLRLYLLAEHADCPESADMFENTRTTFTDHLTRRLAWNMPYHAEHHAFPMVPFHKLPRFHAISRDHLKVTSPSYRAFASGLLRRL